MLTVDQHLAKDSHERETGQRQVGHFDHDANNHTGPVHIRRSKHNSSKSHKDSSGACSVSTNERTGELFFYFTSA